ncbi:hypothetical protein [Dichotomicrobium thermohalophilum]|uniref:Anti-sigma factor NepR domain-containing protein n=1 Tax=Dichotomicrobium thermohalophilum TaxID=933063 RepID=A0A397Q0P5_9HYPH|nr:hypothetical protein [Dichotomicrobium thermohalophilum]RIA55080.1 hypothetical protein BXY53_0133 [Dichotomicrobium thermohalophilum]
MMPRIRTVWMRFSKFVRKLRGFDTRQCDESGDNYYEIRDQGTRDDASDAPPEDFEHDVVVEYHRAKQAKIGQQLRSRYDNFAQEELPRDILDTLADLNQRLKRRDGD